MSEKLSDVFESAIKYGGGGREIQTLHIETSSTVANQEFLVVQFAGTTLPWPTVDDMTEDDIAEDRQTDLAKFREKLSIIRQRIFSGLLNAIEGVEKLKGESK